MSTAPAQTPASAVRAMIAETASACRLVELSATPVKMTLIAAPGTSAPMATA